MLIVQAQALLDAGHPSTLIIPLTTQLIEDVEPLRLRIAAQGKLRRDSDLLLDQLRAIDNQRLIEGPLTRLTTIQLRAITHALKEVMDLG